MPAASKGVPHIGRRGLASRLELVDQSWIRSVIRSHGSTPDRVSRAVSSV